MNYEIERKLNDKVDKWEFHAIKSETDRLKQEGFILPYETEYECEKYCGKNICKEEDEIAKSIRERSLIEAGLYNARKLLKYKRYCLNNAKSLDDPDAKSWLTLASKTDYELIQELCKIGRLCYKYEELYKEKYEDIYYER